MIFEIITLFPGMFDGPFADSIIKRAVEKRLISVSINDMREFGAGSRRTVDDYPYGGDPGMLMQPGPVVNAVRTVKGRVSEHSPKVLFMSPQGEPFSHAIATELAQEKSLIILCGRYKGIDQRALDLCVDREISMGDFVLSGGEIPAMAVVDAISRLIPGVLGNGESAGCDSFFDGFLSPPQYTRPEEFEGLRVPDILISGHHENIRKWQLKAAEEVTRRKRPDLISKKQLEQVNQEV